jgi:hypothetical protein
MEMLSGVSISSKAPGMARLMSAFDMRTGSAVAALAAPTQLTAITQRSIITPTQFVDPTHELRKWQEAGQMTELGPPSE